LSTAYRFGPEEPRWAKWLPLTPAITYYEADGDPQEHQVKRGNLEDAD